MNIKNKKVTKEDIMIHLRKVYIVKNCPGILSLLSGFYLFIYLFFFMKGTNSRFASNNCWIIITKLLEILTNNVLTDLSYF